MEQATTEQIMDINIKNSVMLHPTSTHFHKIPRENMSWVLLWHGLTSKF